MENWSGQWSEHWSAITGDWSSVSWSNYADQSADNWSEDWTGQMETQWTATVDNWSEYAEPNWSNNWSSANQDDTNWSESWSVTMGEEINIDSELEDPNTPWSDDFNDPQNEVYEQLIQTIIDMITQIINQLLQNVLGMQLQGINILNVFPVLPSGPASASTGGEIVGVNYTVVIISTIEDPTTQEQEVTSL